MKLAKRRAHVVIDGQWGSTGKGLLAAYLAQDNKIDVATTNASANAGHTTVFDDGSQMVCYHLPTSGVLNPQATIYLNAGSIIDPELLAQEINDNKVSRTRVVVHPNAAVIRPESRATEAADASYATAIGSTRKGVGEALVDKVRRVPTGTAGTCGGGVLPPMVRVARMNLQDLLNEGKSVMVEIPQGVGLGINSTRSYPYCTSREVSVLQGLADAAIHPEYLGEVVMSLRTYPIRVGNIYDADGRQIGYSGPCYDDQHELDWDELGVAPELTTVTKRPRRIFTWSRRQIEDAFEVNRPTTVFLNFCNYLTHPDELMQRVKDIMEVGQRATSWRSWSPRLLYGFGPKVSDIVEDWNEAVRRVERNNVTVAE